MEEEEIIGVHDAEKSDEKKETKDTKKEEEKEKSTKKMNLKSTRKLLKRNIILPDKSSIKPSKMPKKIMKRSKTKWYFFNILIYFIFSKIGIKSLFIIVEK